MWEYEAVTKLAKEASEVPKKNKRRSSSFGESVKKITITVAGAVLAAYTVKFLKKQGLL